MADLAIAAPRLGATPVDDATAEVRVWAPQHRRVAVAVDGRSEPLEPVGDGTHVGVIKARAGDEYRYKLGDVLLPDPYSRCQPRGVQGPSQLIDIQGLRADRQRWHPPPLGELSIYELHVGTFTDAGTFNAATRHFQQLRDLGVRALELMPVATFPGTRGWGYDGLYIYAPHPAYGTPEDLAMLIQAAHRADLGVLLDVVYNHLGPGAEALKAFGPFQTKRHETFWGDAIDFSQHWVREWAIQNAEQWIRDYDADGLRLDATHAIFDETRPHVLADLAARVKAIRHDALVISEMATGDLRPIEEWGHDAQWGDELHHAVHVLLTGEHEGYYKDYGQVADVANALVRPGHEKIVVCAQNHDQVGNRALGDRLHGRALKIAALCSLISASIPLLFMGEEYDEQHPFQFFTDHIDPQIARATREGRKREFAAFAAFKEERIPDPQDKSTFEESKLDRSHADDETLAYYRTLLELHARLKDEPITTQVDEDRRLLRVRRGELSVAVNFSDVEVDGIPAFTGRILA